LVTTFLTGPVFTPNPEGETSLTTIKITVLYYLTVHLEREGSIYFAALSQVTNAWGPIFSGFRLYVAETVGE
jgi:hypothetical protein